MLECEMVCCLQRKDDCHYGFCGWFNDGGVASEMTFFEAEIIEVFQESKRGKIGCTIDIDPFQNMFF